MRIAPIVASSILLLLIAGCSRGPETLVGRWSCTSTHPGGFASQDRFEFLENGRLALNSDDVKMHGSYTQKERELTLLLEDVPVPEGHGLRQSQQQTLHGTIRKLDSDGLELELKIGGDSHLSQCKRS